MKKLFAACICLCFTFSMAGCSLGTAIDRFLSAGDAPSEETLPDKPRIYMDEIRGTLLNFDGSQITVLSEENTYTFDLSEASLECDSGMIAGDEICVIYEGQLDHLDTSNVKALKIVDEYHKNDQLKEHTAQGIIKNITLNTITLRTTRGNTVTFPITGARQYYQDGLKDGTFAYIHYKGKILTSEENNSSTFDASHLKILSVSDTEPLKIPSPTPTPQPEASSEPEQKLFCTITGLNQNLLNILIEQDNIPLQVDMSEIPCYFPGGIAEGSHVTITYSGEFNGTTLEDIRILGLTGENPASEKESHISFQVTGSIIGKTSNTITLFTNDGANITFYTDQALNASTGGLELNTGVRITYNPAASGESNVFSCLKIEDA